MIPFACTEVVKSQETVEALRIALDTKMALDQEISNISRSEKSS